MAGLHPFINTYLPALILTMTDGISPNAYCKVPNDLLKHKIYGRWCKAVTIG